MSKCTGKNCPLVGNRKDCDLPMCPWRTEEKTMSDVRLIDANALYSKMQWAIDYNMYDKPYDYLAEILDAPTIEPKQGEWIYHEDWKNDGECPYECSECGTAYDYNMNFCGKCGADMRERKDNEIDTQND